jgi:hypothetical protein
MRIAHAKVPKIETARETLATFGPLSLNFPSQYRAFAAAKGVCRNYDNAAILRAFSA